MEPARHRGIAGRVQLHPGVGVITVDVLGGLGRSGRDGRGDGVFCFCLDQGMTFPGLTDRRARLMLATLGFLRLEGQLSPVLHALHRWLDSWHGIGIIERGMLHRGNDIQFTRYDERGWRATFYMSGMEHSPTSATGTAWERTPRRAVQGAAWDTLSKAEESNR